MEIPAELSAKIEETITHYPVSKRSASLPLLHLFQENFGYISDESIDWIAAKLELQPINILELVTFYPMFRRKPAGRNHIRVCRTLSCALAGSEKMMGHLCKQTQIDRPEHPDHHEPICKSEDGRYSIEFVECLASCGSGPVLMVNDDFYEAVTEEEANKILEKYE